MSVVEEGITSESSAPDLELADSDAFSKYLLHTRTEIAFVLNAVVQRDCLLCAYFNGHQSHFLTRLYGLADDKLYLTPPPDEATYRRVLDTENFTVTTSLDRVKVQFQIEDFRPSVFAGRQALAADLPDSLLRLQRREYFRMAMSMSQPVKCQVPLRDGSHLDLVILDISGGGIGLMAMDNIAHHFEVERVYANCKVNLPEEGTLQFNMGVRNMFPVTTKSGARYTRIGCEFLNLPGTRLTMVQRFITRIERERKAKLTRF
ncbi:MAG: hypothetical protein RIR00_2533 [Pseudomonadota bacterium]